MMKVFQEVYPVLPANYGWIETKLSDEVMDKLTDTIFDESIRDYSIDSKLAGHIDKEFSIKKEGQWFFDDVLLPLVGHYRYYFGGKTIQNQMTQDHKFALQDLWVNFQKKHEFNPPHDHTGVFSFVVFHTIPTRWEIENADILGKKLEPVRSTFEFMYIDVFGNIRQHYYNLTPDDEGKILFFPAKLLHQVFPFYGSDDYRITISGNISLDSNEVVVNE